jgi:hypothetical protein
MRHAMFAKYDELTLDRPSCLTGAQRGALAAAPSARYDQKGAAVGLG